RSLLAKFDRHSSPEKLPLDLAASTLCLEFRTAVRQSSFLRSLIAVVLRSNLLSPEQAITAKIAVSALSCRSLPEFKVDLSHVTASKTDRRPPLVVTEQIAQMRGIVWHAQQRGARVGL